MARDTTTSSHHSEEDEDNVDPDFQSRFQTYLDSRASRITPRDHDNRTVSSRHTDSTIRSTATQLDGHQTGDKRDGAAERAARFAEHRRQHSELASAMLYPPAAHTAQHGSQHASVLSYPSTNVSLPQESTVSSSYDVELPARTRRRSSITRRSSILSTSTRLSRISSAISLTPIDVQYPITQHEDPHRASRILGVEQPNPYESEAQREAAHVLQTLSGGAMVAPAAEAIHPLNGKMAWYHAFAAFLVVFNCWGFSNAFGLYQAYYQRYYISNVGASTISYIGSIQLALVFGLGVPVGQMVDKGYFGWFFHGGSIIMILGLFCTSFCTSWASLFIVQGIISGIGMGFVFCSGLVCIMGWFDERRLGLAMAIAAAGSCAGGITYILISRTLLLEQGFGPTVRVLSAIALATMIPPNLIFRMREKIRPRNTPQSRQNRFSIRIFYDGPYLFAAVGLYCSFMGLYFGFVYMISYAAEVLHLSDTDSTNILVYSLVVNLPGRIIPALISDKWLGPLNTMLISVVLSAIVIYIWLFMSIDNEIGQGNLLAIACIYGFVSAGIQSLYAAVTYSFCLQSASAIAGTGRATIDRIGLKAGAVFTCVGIACLIGTPIGGGLIKTNDDGTKDFTGAQTFAAVSLTIGFCFLCLSRLLKVGLRMKRA